MIAPDVAQLQEHWFKKEVSLSWGAVRLSLAVAQELFSSHVVDSGSLLLLRSFDPNTLPNIGTCVDFGCGYGVLGLAFKAVKPDWNVTLIDRDALAVEFSQWNAKRLDLDVECKGGLDLSDQDVAPDFVLWNVPGKAGVPVLQALTAHVLDCLADNGMLALIVVHPLARELEAIALVRKDITITHESAGPEHTIFHMKRTASSPMEVGAETFDQGAFDREPVDVDTGLLTYRFTPVVGLPQYDGPDIATVLLTDCVESVGRTDVMSALCVAPGQGHVPAYLRHRWPGTDLTFADRDLLALRASSRVAPPVCEIFAAADYRLLDREFDLVTVMLPNQIRPAVSQHLLTQMLGALNAGSHLAIGGGSTEVSRFVAMVRKYPELKLSQREKRKGFSAAIFERR